MTSITEAQAKTNYADRVQLEKAGAMAITLCQWEVAQKHFESALALLPDEHHIDTHRLSRQISICRAMATTSPAMRPVRDNPLYRAEERERIAEGERQWNREWNGHE